MSEIEKAGSVDGLPIAYEVITSTPSEFTGMPEFDLPTFLERQDVINGILERTYSTDEARVADLNLHIGGWDDERGINYTYIAGRTLPGLVVDVPAVALAFAANYAPEARMRGIDMSYAVLTGSVMPDCDLSGSTLNHAVMPFSVLSGKARGVSGVKAIMNFADVSGLDMSGFDIGAGYIIGTTGLDEEKLLSLADYQQAISHLADSQIDPSLVSLLGDGVSYFSTDTAADALRKLVYPKLFSGVNASGTIFNKARRNLRQGMVLNDAMIVGAEMSKYDFEGSIWNGVDASLSVAVATKFAGAVILNSRMSNIQSNGVIAPGMLTVGSDFRGTAMPKNSAGAVFLGCDLRGASMDQSQEGGSVIIGGRRPEGLEDTPFMRVLNSEELHPLVASNLSRCTRITVKPVNASLPSAE